MTLFSTTITLSVISIAKDLVDRIIIRKFARQNKR